MESIENFELETEVDCSHIVTDWLRPYNGRMRRLSYSHFLSRHYLPMAIIKLKILTCATIDRKIGNNIKKNKQINQK